MISLSVPLSPSLVPPSFLPPPSSLSPFPPPSSPKSSFSSLPPSFIQPSSFLPPPSLHPPSFPPPLLPVELVFSENPLTNSLSDIPFKVFDSSTFSARPLSPSDGYLYYMTKALLQPPPSSHSPLPPSSSLLPPPPFLSSPILYLISITIFSEPLSELLSTLTALYSNLSNFIQNGISPHQFCVVVIFDGVQAISQDIRHLFRQLDEENRIPPAHTLDHRERIFLDDLKLLEEDGENIFPTLSTYVYEWNFVPNLNSEQKKDSPYFLKTLLSVKLKNAQKLSSVFWFFRGFCELIEPKYCSLLDCGTITLENALYKKFIIFENEDDIGGLCGFVKPTGPTQLDSKDLEIINQYDIFTRTFHRVFDLKQAQVFEYVYGHIIDKSFESFFGMVYVLPGAYASFRWEAIRKDEGAMDNYLDSLFIKLVMREKYRESDEFTIELANMCLAEDQMLTFEINTKAGHKFISRFIPDSVALTDPVKTFNVLIKQRKRWINGSWFAFTLILSVYWRRMRATTHHWFRKGAFHFFTIYQLGQMINRWCLLCFSFSLVYILSVEFFNFYRMISFPMINSQFGYITFFLIAFFVGYHMSLFYKIDQKIKIFLLCSTLIGLSIHVFNALIFAKLIGFLPDYFDPEGLFEEKIIISFIIFNLFYYLLPLLANWSNAAKDALCSVVHFIYHFPSFFVFFQLYSFCNINDLSWGTKAKENEKANQSKAERNKLKNGNFAFLWVFTNLLVAVVCTGFFSNFEIRKFYILGISVVYGVLLSIKLVCALMYKFKYECWNRPRAERAARRKEGEYRRRGKEVEEYIESNRKWRKERWEVIRT